MPGISAEANVKCSYNYNAHRRPQGVITSMDQRARTTELWFMTERRSNMLTHEGL